MTTDGVLVALSGGVDSAVALVSVAARGRRVEAAIVKLWPGDDPRSCCGPTAIARAQAAADAAGVRLHVLDEQARFARTVVEPFVAAYLGGETPNPCVRCNPQRLAALVALADSLGLARVATGHYARLVTRGGEPWADRRGTELPYLARGEDRGKDQSYMLAAVPPEVLGRLEFPLGEQTKPAVRAAARAAGLTMADQPESQEVCFALEGYRAFLEERGVRPRKGPVVDREGRVLGEHHGQWRFTIGQRRGLRVSADEPLYVVERRAAGNEVVVGGADDLLCSVVAVRDVADRGIAVAEPAGDLTVQLRYRSAAVPVAGVEPLSSTGDEARAGEAAAPAGALLVRLAAPFSAPAPGQTAVFYCGDTVVGAGVIDGPRDGSGARRTAGRHAPIRGARPGV
jgi:tRNA-uridine 2-sulfurtransferase